MHETVGERLPVLLKVGGVVQAFVVRAGRGEECGLVGVALVVADVPDVEVGIEDLDRTHAVGLAHVPASEPFA